MTPKTGKRIHATFAHMAAVFASLIAFIPVYLVAVNSLKSSAEAGGLSPDLPTDSTGRTSPSSSRRGSS